MTLCSGCLQKVNLLVEQPQLLKVHPNCDGCKSIKKSFEVTDVVLQLVGGHNGK